jgi:hypothetical protein
MVGKIWWSLWDGLGIINFLYLTLVGCLTGYGSETFSLRNLRTMLRHPVLLKKPDVYMIPIYNL